jgi:ABC-type multidrug transport system fused ATPase/permease subunit
MARDFHLRAAAQTIEGFSRAPYVRPGLEDVATELRFSVASYPRVMGKAIEQMTATLQAACYVAGFLVVLLSISVEVSLFTLPIFLLVLPFLYRLSTQTQKAAKSFFGQAGRQVANFARAQLQASDQTNVHPDAYGASQREQFRRASVVSTYLDTYDQIRLSQRRSILITSLFRGFLLCLIIVVLGFFSIRQTYSWGELLVYVLALWQLANQVQIMLASLVKLNRYQPRIANYYEVQAALSGRVGEVSAESGDTPIVIQSHGTLERDAGRLSVKRGDRIFYLTDAAVSRTEFASVLAPLIDACPNQRRIWRNASFSSGLDASPKLSLAAMVLGSESPDDEARARLETRAAEIGLADELALLPGGIATVLDEETWRAMSQKLRVALRVLSLAESRSEVSFVDWTLVGSVEKDFANRLLDLLADRILFLVSRDPRVDCEWAQILEYRRNRIPTRRVADVVEDDLEDEDDDM